MKRGDIHMAPHQKLVTMKVWYTTITTRGYKFIAVYRNPFSKELTIRTAKTIKVSMIYLSDAPHLKPNVML